jgi:hypothetical protein
LGVDSGKLLATPRRWRGHAGVQEVDTISRAWSSSSFSSRRGGGSRLEIGGAAGCFGRAPAHRSNAPKIKRGCHEVRQKERREIGGRRGEEVHRRCRICTDTPAGSGNSGEGSGRPGGVSAREKGEERNGVDGALKGRTSLERGLGFRPGGEIGRRRKIPCRGWAPARGRG